MKLLSDRYWQLLQSNLNVASQVLTIAQQLGVPNPDRWAAAVLAHAQQTGSVNGEQLLQAARLAALGAQLAQPAGKMALSLEDIRQLANDHARADRASRTLPGKDSGPKPVPTLTSESIGAPQNLRDTGQASGQPTATVASVAGGNPQPPQDGRPLPAAVAEVAQRLGLSLAEVQRIRDALGGTFGATDAVAYLKSRDSSPLGASQASELVKTIRSAQQESTRSVSAAVDAALARSIPPGQPPAVFTFDDWDAIEPQLNAQPALDNPAARKLRALLLGGRVDSGARLFITRYLKSVGDEFKLPAGEFGESKASPIGNITTPDEDFAKLLIVTGQTQARVDVGVVDYFSTTEPGQNTRFNSQTVPPAVSSPGTDHGHGTTSLIGQVGRWANIKTSTMRRGELSNMHIERLVEQDVRVINLSLSPNFGDASPNSRFVARERAEIAGYSNVLFVRSAGNSGQSSESQSTAYTSSAGLPNVIYVGNVDERGNLNRDSTYGKAVDIYAPGVRRQVVSGSGEPYRAETGTSFSAPQVTSVAAKMLVLCPKLKPQAVRAIILETASAPPVGAADADGSVARAGILNGGAAMKVAALIKGVERFGSLEKAATAMKLSEDERTRLIPIARRQV